MQKQFGARRVFDSPLDETSIIGFASGFGHNGFVTIPEIQFFRALCVSSSGPPGFSWPGAQTIPRSFRAGAVGPFQDDI